MNEGMNEEINESTVLHFRRQATVSVCVCIIHSNHGETEAYRAEKGTHVLEGLFCHKHWSKCFKCIFL